MAWYPYMKRNDQDRDYSPTRNADRMRRTAVSDNILNGNYDLLKQNSLKHIFFVSSNDPYALCLSRVITDQGK